MWVPKGPCVLDCNIGSRLVIVFERQQFLLVLASELS